MMEVHNWNLEVGDIQVESVASSSVFLIGDNDYFILSSFFDTPPESYYVGPIVPLAPVGGG
ncbi:spore gernimation protein GerPD [Virgibacillus soli]